MSSAAALPLSGTEDVTWLWTGRAPGPPLLPPGVVPVLDAQGAATVGLLALRLRDLGLRAVPAPRFSYQEVLWWVLANVGGAPAWYIMRCDLDRWWALPMVRTGVGYPVVQTPLVIRADALAMGNDLALRAGDVVLDAPPPATVDRLATKRGETLLEVPFSLDGLAQGSRVSLTLARDGLGARVFGTAVAWEDRAVVCTGRQHACGFGRAVPR